MPLIMFIKSVDDDFRYLECNENYAQFLGKNINEIIGKTDADLLKRKEDVEYIRQHDIETIEAKHPVVLHETVTDGAGRTGHYMTVKFQATGLDGKSVLVGMALDETEDYNRRQTLDNMLDDWEKVANVACIGSYRVDRNMHVLSATDRMAQFWPVGADGKPLPAEDYLLPEDTAAYNHMYESVFSGEQEQASMLCRIPHPDGMRYLRLFIRRKAEHPDEVSGLLQDVTVHIREQKKREALLAMWKNVVNTLPALFFVKNADDDFRYLQINEKFSSQLGLKPENVIGRREQEFFPNTVDAERNRKEDIRTMEAGKRQDFVEQIHVKDNELRHYQTVKIPSVDEEGRRILIAMSQDITDEQELSESRKIISSAFETLFSSDDLEEDMRVILKNICDFIGFDRAYIACVDEAANGVRVFSAYRPEGTKSLFDLKNFQIEHATTLPWYINLLNSVRDDVFRFDFSDPHDLEAARCHVPSILARAEKFDLRGVHINYVSVKGKPWGCLGFITSGHTVKHLSVHEANLLKVTAHIVELAITRKRVMDKLSSALNNALAADKAKTFFLSSMSHEIRTPLNAVIGFTDLLKDPELDQETRNDYLNSVADASQALLTLLNDILELSKLSSSKVQALSVMTDMQKFMNETGAIFRPGARQKQLALEISANGVPHLFVDQPRLRQILFNLIGNAIKFTREGGVKALLAFAREDVDYGELTIQVTDTGIGIAPEDRQKMFEPFVQMSRMRGTNASGTGTGLGMAIVKKIVEQEDGELYLDSEVGRGSTFTIVIPKVYMHPMKKEPEQEIMPELPSGAVKPAKHSKIPRVLIVDDAEMALEILSRMLNWMHVPYMKASSAQEALDILREEDFDILMTDLLMPGMNGMELAGKIRRSGRYPDLRIAVVTADTEAGNNFDSQTFDAVLSKPVTIEKLRHFIGKMEKEND